MSRRPHPRPRSHVSARSHLGAAVAFALLAVACATSASISTTTTTVPQTPTEDGSHEAGSHEDGTIAATSIPSTAAPTTASPTTIATTTTIDPYAAPSWLGSRILPLREDGHGEVQDTPPELVDRRIATPPLLPPPTSDTFEATISPVPDDVAARSSWVEACPVTLDDLAYLTVTHIGFDGKSHTGELLVNATVAADIVWVFEQLYDARFPIEQMRVITKEEIDAPPTGDWNDTTSFVCRPAVGSTRWSQHAYGLAIDINPFHNPYLKGDLVLPELASAYLERDRDVPGMIQRNDVVFQAFAEIGWPWGGDWNSLKDWMHFSQSGN